MKIVEYLEKSIDKDTSNQRKNVAILIEFHKNTNKDRPYHARFLFIETLFLHYFFTSEKFKRNFGTVWIMKFKQ